MLAVYDMSLPPTVFDTRTGRRVARLESEGRTVDRLTWSDDGAALIVSWVPREPELDDGGAGEAQELPALPPRRVVMYDRRGRELTSLTEDPEAGGGEGRGWFDGQRGAVALGGEARVVDLRTRAVTAITAERPIDSVAWHGSVVRVTVSGGGGARELTHGLYAAGATTPYFQSEGHGDFSADARWLFQCQQGELVRVRVADVTRTVFGACQGAQHFPSDDGRFVAMPQGDHLRVVREDGASIRLGALPSVGADVLAYAVDEGTGRYQVYGAAPEDARVRYRQPGAATSAPVVTLEEAAGARDPQLLQRFFGW
jgi:hypothetical protein